MSIVGILSHAANDLVFFWLMFNLAFSVLRILIEEKAIENLIKKIDNIDYHKIAKSIPKDEEENETEGAKSTVEESK